MSSISERDYHPPDDERLRLENELFDAEIVVEDLRRAIDPLLTDYRDARRWLHQCRARLAHHEFLTHVAATFGPDAAAVVAAHTVSVRT